MKRHIWSGLEWDCLCGYSGASFNRLMDHFESVGYEGAVITADDVMDAIDSAAYDYAPLEPSFQEYFGALYKRALNLLIERQRKYGPENIRRQGLFGIFTRLRDDKMARLANSINGKIERGEAFLVMDEMADEESIEDTLIDIANYALIMLSVYRGEWCPPLGED